MERPQLFDLMDALKLYDMQAAFDKIMATTIKRQHEPQRIVGDRLKAEISKKQARSLKYQLTIAKAPLAKDLDDFEFEVTPINKTMVKDLAAHHWRNGAGCGMVRVEIVKLRFQLARFKRAQFDRSVILR